MIDGRYSRDGRIEVIDRLLLRTSEVPWVVFSGGASSPPVPGS